MALCTPERHVWTRPDTQMHSKVPADRSCDCGAVAFGRLAKGSEYQTVYTKDGETIFSGDHIKE